MTMTIDQEDGQSRKLIPSRVELINPTTNWEDVWRRSRLRGLGSELASFIFKVLHQLLPTAERVHKTNPKSSALCRLCSLGTTEDLLHALISCPGNGGVGRKVVDCVTDHVLAESDLHLLRLDFQAEEAHELPVVWFLAASWLSMWEAR